MAKKSSSNRKKQTESAKVDTPEVKDEPVVENVEVSKAAEDSPNEPSEIVEDAIEITEQIEPDEPVSVEESQTETTTYEQTPSPEHAAKQQGSFIPLVLGGVFAGIIGYGIATYQRGDNTVDLKATIATQADEIASLRDEVSELATLSATSGITEQLEANTESLNAITARIDTDIPTLEDRMTAIEKQPSADGTLQEAAIAAYERDIAELRDQIAVQQDEMRDLLSETRQEAQSIEENAIASARVATARASLAVIQTSLEGGKAFGAALTDLETSVSEPLPEALAAAKDGVATLAQLQAEFPDLSRAALATARREGVSGEDESGLAGFMRNQFQVQSVGPQDGDTADAVLSRAQAAVNEGRLNDSLAELASLHEAARAELSSWIGEAEQRAAALDAVAMLASQLNVN